MRKKLGRSLLTAAGAVLIGAAGIGIAVAGTTNVAYNTSVAPFNGSGYTAYQTQSTSGASGQLHSGSVGGSYQVDARMDGPSDSDWVRNVTDNDSRTLTGNDNNRGNSVRLQLSNDLNTRVSVQASGSWRTN